MRHLASSTIRLPLFLRVVALYVLIGVPIWSIVSIQPPPQVRANALPPKPVVVIPVKNVVSGQPTSINVPRLGIELPVIDGQYDKSSDSWTLNEDKAQFATVTALPNNETGNTFIYGHNTAAVFAPLAQLQAGDEAIVRTTNGLAFKYTLGSTQLVNPDTTSVLESTSAPTLTLMTCEGLFDETRRVAVFNFEKVL